MPNEMIRIISLSPRDYARFTIDQARIRSFLSAVDVPNMADRASTVVKTEKRYEPEFKQTLGGAADLTIPKYAFPRCNKKG